MRRTSTSLLPCAFVLTASIVGTPSGVVFAQESPSAADLAQARPLLNQAFKLREQGDLPGALEKFKAAHSLAETPITGTELGRAYMAVGKLVEARETFLSVARIPHRSAETEHSTVARAESAKLADQIRARIPSVTISVQGAVGTPAAVTVDGAEVPADAIASPRFLNPGTHELVATSAGRRAETNVDLKEGETREAILKFEPPPASSAAPSMPTPSPTPASIELARAAPPSTSSGQSRRIAGVVILGAGVVAAGVGGVLALVAKSQDNTAATETFPAKHDDSLNASHLVDAATVVVSAGAAIAVAGAVVWFAAPRSRAAVGMSSSGVWLRGSF